MDSAARTGNLRKRAMGLHQRLAQRAKGGESVTTSPDSPPPQQPASTRTVTVTQSPGSPGTVYVTAQPDPTPEDNRPNAVVTQTVYVQQVTVGPSETSRTSTVTISYSTMPVATVVPILASAVSGSIIASGSATLNVSSTAVIAVSGISSGSISVATLPAAVGIPTASSSMSAPLGANVGALGTGGAEPLGTGAIVGITVGALAALLLLAALILMAIGRRRERERRFQATDMMGPSHLPDPYSNAYLSSEVPGSFVRFHEDESYGSGLDNYGGAAGMGAAAGGAAAGSRMSNANAYDDYSQDDDGSDLAGPPPRRGYTSRSHGGGGGSVTY